MLTRDAHKSFFRQLGEHRLIIDDLLPLVEEFVCAIYGQKKVKEVNNARFEMFKQRLNSSGVIDLSIVPPCKSVLLLHLQRSALVANIWKQAKTARTQLLA